MAFRFTNRALFAWRLISVTTRRLDGVDSIDAFCGRSFSTLDLQQLEDKFRQDLVHTSVLSSDSKIRNGVLTMKFAENETITVDKEGRFKLFGFTDRDRYMEVIGVFIKITSHFT